MTRSVRRAAAITVTMATVGALSLAVALPASAAQYCVTTQVPTAATKPWYDFAHTANPFDDLGAKFQAVDAGIRATVAPLTAAATSEQISAADDAVEEQLELFLEGQAYLQFESVQLAEQQLVTSLQTLGDTTASSDVSTLLTPQATALLTALNALYASSTSGALADYENALDDQLSGSSLSGPVSVPSSAPVLAAITGIYNATEALFSGVSSKIALQPGQSCLTADAPSGLTLSTPSTGFGLTPQLTIASSLPRGQSGKVAVYVDGAPFASVPLADAITLALPATLGVGPHYVTAAFVPDGGSTILSGGAILTVTKAKVAASVKLSHSKIKHGKKVKATVTLTAPGTSLRPTGKVTLLAGKKVIKTVTLKAKNKGKTVITLPKSLVSKKGTVKLSAKFAGSASYASDKSKTVKLKLK